MSASGQPTRAPDARQILHERARALARVPDNLPTADASITVLEFRLGDERYAVETRYVREVIPLTTLTALPCTPGFVAGIVNVRGVIVTVLDLKKFFDLPDSGLTDLHRIIHVEGDGLDFGLLADASVGVQNIALNDLRMPLVTLSGSGADYLSGVADGPVMVLDMARILGDPGIIVHDEIGIEE